MTALHNRALALKLAIENSVSTYREDPTKILDSSGAINEDILDGVLALADRFVTYLGADEPNTTGAVPSGDIATPAPAPAPDVYLEIRTLLGNSRDDLGCQATDAALGQLSVLRRATAGQSRAQVIETAVNYVGDVGRREFGSAVAGVLVDKLRAL